MIKIILSPDLECRHQEDFARKDVRVVEGVDLERLYDITIIEGSNPSLSENFLLVAVKNHSLSFFYKKLLW